MGTLLRVENLQTHFKTERGVVKAVDGVSYDINEGEIVGLVGESGCGKSVSMLSLLKLIPSPPGKIVGGSAYFNGEDILKIPLGPRLRSIRGGEISVIFQEPMTSLNPALNIRRQMTEMLEIHKGMDMKEATKRSIELLDMVGIPDAKNRIFDYPHQFSGGMRQRVMVAMAISCEPKLIIADEPTTALDATIQAQLLELINEMVKKFNTAMVLVTHNLGIVARYASRINVMYAGRIIESGTVTEIWDNPRHPYTIGLLQSVPMLELEEKKRLVPIEGLPPNLINLPPTCPFLPRCCYRIEQCLNDPWPDLEHVGGQQHVRCYVNTGGI